MPLVSIVVPVYNVETYLDECLESVARQTAGDLEVVMVDDGSTDRSADMAAGWADRDPRFRLVSQENRGLGGARNTGAREATGELLMFVDSDDVLPPDAVEHLSTALAETGSDFATGNVWRLRPSGLSPSAWLAPVFAETRLRTHVTSFRPLVADRVAWNKLWRRTFWDAHGFRFPERVLYEDTPVTVPAHFLAKSVDVISAPVYYWRARGAGDRSITQRRTEVKALTDRLASIQSARGFLKSYPVPEALTWYDANVVADDLAPYPALVVKGDETFRREFIARVNVMLDDMDPEVFTPLPPDARARWERVRARDLDGLVQLVREQQRGADAGVATFARRVSRRIPRRVRRLVPQGVRRRVLRYRRR
jgi:CDP-glycerol glycerophosphotransferase